MTSVLSFHFFNGLEEA